MLGFLRIGRNRSHSKPPAVFHPERPKEDPAKVYGRRCLKVKIKSLAEESRIIRLEESRAKGELLNRLHNHRVIDVRREARATHLAYNFIRGRTYVQTEGVSRFPIPKERVQAMVKKYAANPNWERDLEAWLPRARSEG